MSIFDWFKKKPLKVEQIYRTRIAAKHPWTTAEEASLAQIKDMKDGWIKYSYVFHSKLDSNPKEATSNHEYFIREDDFRLLFPALFKDVLDK